MGPKKGYKQTPEHRAAISAAMKASGWKPTQEMIANAAKVNRGRKHTAEQRQKIKDGIARARAEGKQIGHPRLSQQVVDAPKARKQRDPSTYKGPRVAESKMRYKDSNGYVMVGLIRDDGKVKGIQEHRLVMQQHIGRPLLPEETVHHRNGIRDDNRIENLELWVRRQPTGARVVDLLAWAHEVIERYEGKV